MSMLPDGIIPIETGKDGQVLDFVWTTNHALITDYYRLDEKIIAENDSVVKTAGRQNRMEIASIKELKSALAKFVTESKKILQRYTLSDFSNPYTIFGFSDLTESLLVEQLVFDILFDKYRKESPLMTCNGYSNYMSRKLYTDKIQRMACARAINENIRRGMKSYYNMMKYSLLRDQIKSLGADPSKYYEYHHPPRGDNSRKKKPQYLWDYFFYNFGRNLKKPVSDDKSNYETKYGRGMITSRQYRRQLTRDSRNYPFEEIFQDLEVYHDFATKLLPVDNESHEKFFRMSMDYYILESYKRVDFIFKLIDALSSNEIAAIDRSHFLVKRLVPRVLVPFMQNGELHFGWKWKYYRPLLIIEDEILEEVAEIKELTSNALNYMYYETVLRKYQYVRAKAYELFKYHCVFSSNDYVEIKKFLHDCYNMRAYHQSNTFWNLMQDAKRKGTDEETKDQVKERIRCFLSINDALFWKSPDRDYTIPNNN